MGMTPLPVLKRRLALLRDQLKASGVGIKGESLAWSLVQGALSRGDSQLAQTLAVMDDTNLPNWSRAVRESGLDADYYIHQQWSADCRLPWSVVASDN
jgi:hypothetical protein